MHRLSATSFHADEPPAFQSIRDAPHAARWANRGRDTARFDQGHASRVVGFPTDESSHAAIAISVDAGYAETVGPETEHTDPGDDRHRVPADDRGHHPVRDVFLFESIPYRSGCRQSIRKNSALNSIARRQISGLSRSEKRSREGIKFPVTGASRLSYKLAITGKTNPFR